jgi:Zn-dependent protease
VSIRPLRQSIRPSPIFLAIVAITALGGGIAWITDVPGSALSYLGVFIFVVFGWLVSLCLHEFGHAYLAWRFGDRDVELRGYLTLNPLKYSNPLLSLGIPVLFIALGGIGLPGGAVYLNTWSMTKWQRTAISLAGPAANLVLGIVLLTLTATLGSAEHLVFWSGVAFLGFLQVTAVVLNLLPVPGFDGYGALEPHLSPQTQRQLAPVKQWGFLVLLLLLMAPQLSAAFFGLIDWIVTLFGVNGDLWRLGGALTRFWSGWL